jgi:hypothetical protein
MEKKLTIAGQAPGQKKLGLPLLFALAVLALVIVSGYKYHRYYMLQHHGLLTIAHVDDIGVGTKTGSYSYSFLIDDHAFTGICNNEKKIAVLKDDSLYVRYDPNNPENNEPASDMLINKTK